MSAEWHDSLVRLEDSLGGETLSASGVCTPNSQHSVHLRRIGKWTSFCRVEAYHLGDGATKGGVGRAQIDHASDTIIPWMDSGDTSKEPLGWRSELTSNEL